MQKRDRAHVTVDPYQTYWLDKGAPDQFTLSGFVRDHLDEKEIPDILIPASGRTPFGIPESQFEWVLEEAPESFDLLAFVREELDKIIPDDYKPESPTRASDEVLATYQKEWLAEESPGQFTLQAFVTACLKERIPDEYRAEQDALAEPSAAELLATDN